jgi:acyl-CoA synthetase (AMP-forming)/AMP-acid ligase II
VSTVWTLLEQQADQRSDDLIAVDEHGNELTFTQARDAALCLARGLHQRGISRGDVVSWQLPNWLDAIVLCLALSRLQVVQNPIVAILGEREVGFICRQARSRLLIVPRQHGRFDFVAMAADIAARTDGVTALVVSPGDFPSGDGELPVLVDEPANTVRWLFYTSGTTADPKGARHTDQTLIAGARGFVEALGITDRDRVSGLLPLTHIGGIIHVIASLLTGAPMVIAASFDPEKTIEHLRERRATTIPGAMPFVHAYFAYQDRHPEITTLFPHARVMTHGGSPKPPALHYEAKRRIGTVGIVSGYGMTECPMAVWNRPEDPDEDLARTEGTPVAGVELRIVDDEVRVSGPQMMLGYVDSSLDEQAFDADGFFCSGDLGEVDQRGRLTITGRLKDIIIRNMENISATELENLIHPHPKVREVAVIGLPHEITGEIACAVVTPVDPSHPPTLAELCEHLLAEGLSGRKLPERLELVDQLPRNAMDKLLKNELRTRFGA